MTGMTSSIIHSGLLLDSRKASTTLSRLAIFLRLASLVASFISLRSWSESSSMSMPREELQDRLPAHAGREGLLAQLVEQLPVALLGEELALGLSVVSLGSMTMYDSQ